MLETLAKLRHIADDIATRPGLIKQAREHGATWEQIAEAARMSRAGVIKLHSTHKENQL